MQGKTADSAFEAHGHSPLEALHFSTQHFQATKWLKENKAQQQCTRRKLDNTALGTRPPYEAEELDMRHSGASKQG